ncbi:proton channel OtopLc-like isoform X3 [Sitophilus oryzae]|uniref:Proton channel OtopLc-like isoform X3 n=1 Tax=Sitophilus oryzae TaxID=7048 RepID=A0A6J2XHN6_SITOR|nr:proton channel OtopLc-like isoform X3 [Sitophilus oryzae]
MEAPNYPTPPIPVAEEVTDSQVSSEVVLRYPRRTDNNMDNRTSTLRSQHSHSTSDLVKYRSQPLKYYPKESKNDKTLVLPINRSRPLSSVASYDGSFREHNNRRPISSHPDDFNPYNELVRTTSISSALRHGTYNNNGFVESSGDVINGTLRKSPSSFISESHPPSTPLERRRMFVETLSTIASIIYAVLVVTLGVSLYVVDFLDIESQDMHLLAEGLSLFVLLVALLYLLYLTVDISIYMRKKGQFEKLTENFPDESLEIKSSEEGVHYNTDLQKALALNKYLDHRYCLNKDRHSSNFYLKVGATGFCFGHLIHSILILTYRGIILNSKDDVRSECVNIATYIIEVMYPIYSILLLFFIFKYSNVIVNKNITVHRFGFMHCLAASLCFWIWTIFRETAEYIEYQRSYSGYDNSTESASTETYSYYEISENLTELSNLAVITPMRFTRICDHEELNVLYQNYSPYLYPFSVEYSILVVGILYILWMNIGLCSPSNPTDEENYHGDDPRECKNYKPVEAESNVTIHADCHAANKGLFGGFIILVFSIVSVILFFITYYNESVDMAENGRIINNSTKIVIIFLMIVGAIYAYSQMAKLDVNKVAHNSMDNFLLLMCLPAFFVHGIFSIIPAVTSGNVLAVITIVFEIVQILIQTPFIIDGMARSSNTKELRKQKPGREMVTFLIICNIAMWLMQTFEVKSHGLDQYRQEFYTKELWSIVGHMCLPLMMFYRFHASACICDIWKFAYIPSGH